jgi:hypothetical protein
MSKEITRRKFIEDVAKYCGAGVAALGVLGPIRAHAQSDVLDTPIHSGVWQDPYQAQHEHRRSLARGRNRSSFFGGLDSCSQR